MGACYCGSYDCFKAENNNADGILAIRVNTILTIKKDKKPNLSQITYYNYNKRNYYANTYFKPKNRCSSW